MPEWWILGGLSVLGLSAAMYPLRHKKALVFVLLPAAAAFW